MSNLTTSAPGKLVLMGEYAVLEGAPALALAVDRRARVRIGARSDGLCEVNAPDLGVTAARGALAAGGTLRWQCAAADAERLRLVGHICRGLARDGLCPPAGSGFDLHLDTAGFFETGAAGRAKLGLGSSAALTVALASALARFAGHDAAVADRAGWLQRLIGLHGAWQGGRGSGVDIAASLSGGLIEYRTPDAAAAPGLTPLDWPIAGLHCLFVWSGEAVSTGDFLQRLARWRQHHGAEYAAHMRALGALAEAGAEAAREGRGAALVAALAAYATALDAFAAASGLQIFSPAQRRLAALATRSGASFKPCGAGGDVGVIVVQEADRLARITRSIITGGMQCLSLTMDPVGLHCSRAHTCRTH